MRVLICPQRFAGTLTAVQAAEAMAAGWSRRAPHDEVSLAPLSGGGAGFLDVMSAALDGALTVATTVSDPLGRDVPAAVLLTDQGGVVTAYVEAAQANGGHLLGGGERNPAVASSFGVGQLVDVARAEGATRIVVGVGDAASNDGGAGLLAALGVGDVSTLARGGAALAGVAAGDLDGLGRVREHFAEVEVVVATQEDLPLLGLQGTSAATAGGRGASPEQAQQLEFALGRFREVVDEVSAATVDLLTGAARRVDRLPGAGAGGGLGYGLMVLGARRWSAAQWCLQAWGMPELASRIDLVVTGEGCLDHRSMHGGVVAEVSAAVSHRAVPVVALAGEVMVGRREWMEMGLAGAYAVASTADQVAAAMADPVCAVRERTARLAATWSPAGGAV
ncbi:Glycerate 3-kinase [Austwickia sp. TVS 96-490-7B]|uniref:glycerate kinase n=1 Tax=Austwickia sp. TVS 96-490-7B TaxID=2830843 RepID=UPI001C569968|nr:glycerate kinase [Austwickia sp. TVS 96-490-7B]MBW3086081.1 Glycerate 3-kinase [Austwickia sp. TVS 96-490-7B]